MKNIQIEDDLYHFIASQTQDIGESASDILRRLDMPESLSHLNKTPQVAETKAVNTIDNDAGILQSQDNTCHASAVLSELAELHLQDIPKVVDRWLLVLSIIHKHHPQPFSKVLGMSGRNRTYFATDKDSLYATGGSTNPKNVPHSSYWVITNNNTVKKINMLKQVAEQVGFSANEIEALVKVFVPELIEKN